MTNHHGLADGRGRSLFVKRAVSVFAAISMTLACAGAMADEGGVSFWLPGQFGSLAAVPTEPGWSMGTVYFHMSGDEGANKAYPRGGRITAGVDATADLLFLAPTYAFREPVLGGQAALSVIGAFGRMKVDINATLSGPGGGVLSGAQSDSLTSVADLYPLGTLKWNRGVHNFMAYTMWGIPVGSYEVGRLANIGTNHWSADAGGGYTYLDPKKGHEFSAVMGMTYNFENKDTNYKNGIDGHLDWAASQFLNPQLHAGLVGYFYHQLTGDSGAGATLGDFKSRVSAVGPQVGYFFPVNGQKWYVNLKGFYEFDAKNRPEGWNVWLTLAIPLSSGKK
jgi:hypothetical protein